MTGSIPNNQNPQNPILRFAVGALAVVLAAAPVAAQEVLCAAVDGDTLQCGDERVRVMGLDAPEMNARCPEELRLALAATTRLRELVADGVTLQPAGRDRYRRLLAVVLDHSGNDVAAVLIREGLAREYHGRGRRGGWC